MDSKNPYQYYEVTKNMQPFDKVKIRLEMVKHARKESISDAAGVFNTSRLRYTNGSGDTIETA